MSGGEPRGSPTMPSRDGDGKVYSDVGSSNPLQDVIIVLLYQAYPYPPPQTQDARTPPGFTSSADIITQITLQSAHHRTIPCSYPSTHLNHHISPTGSQLKHITRARITQTSHVHMQQKSILKSTCLLCTRKKSPLTTSYLST